MTFIRKIPYYEKNMITLERFLTHTLHLILCVL